MGLRDIPGGGSKGTEVRQVVVEVKIIRLVETPDPRERGVGETSKALGDTKVTK